jgi:transposase-like protein
MKEFPRDDGQGDRIGPGDRDRRSWSDENDAGTGRPDPEVPERARRRTFTAKYKLEILAAYDAAGEGEKGALLRREGLYSSHIVAWRRARDAGALAGLAAPRGRKRRDPQAELIARLETEKRQLEQELAKTRFVVDVQAKLALLETLSESADTGNGSTT